VYGEERKGQVRGLFFRTIKLTMDGVGDEFFVSVEEPQVPQVGANRVPVHGLGNRNLVNGCFLLRDQGDAKREIKGVWHVGCRVGADKNPQKREPHGSFHSVFSSNLSS